MKKIQVTAQQRANAIEARDVMWPSVPPENVYSGLRMWRNAEAQGRPEVDCGTHACFGGWCAAWPAFQKQGLRPDRIGAPTLSRGFNRAELGPRTSESVTMFGANWLFMPRGEATPDHEAGQKSDHALVTHRLNQLIENSEVIG